MWVSWLNPLDSKLKQLKVIPSLLVGSHFPLILLLSFCAPAFALSCLPPFFSFSSLSFCSSPSLPLFCPSRPPLSMWNPRSSEDRTPQDRVGSFALRPSHAEDEVPSQACCSCGSPWGKNGGCMVVFPPTTPLQGHQFLFPYMD